jgi:hypothetical protein
MTTPRSKIWFHEFRPGGPRAAESQALHNQVLDLWADHKTKREIATMLEIDIHTVRKITWAARKAGDPRGFAQTKPLLLSTSFSSHSVLDIYREQYIVRGLARAFEVPHAQVEAALRAIADELKETDGK